MLKNLQPFCCDKVAMVTSAFGTVFLCLRVHYRRVFRRSELARLNVSSHNFARKLFLKLSVVEYFKFGMWASDCYPLITVFLGKTCSVEMKSFFLAGSHRPAAGNLPHGG